MSNNSLGLGNKARVWRGAGLSRRRVFVFLSCLTDVIPIPEFKDLDP